MTKEVSRRSVTHISFYACLVYHLVYVVCSHSRNSSPSRNIKNFSRQPADLPHALLLLLVENGDIVLANKLLFRPRYAISSIVRMRYSLRNLPPLGERITRPQRASKRVRRERIVQSGVWIGFRNYFRGDKGT